MIKISKKLRISICSIAICGLALCVSTLPDENAVPSTQIVASASTEIKLTDLSAATIKCISSCAYTGVGRTPVISAVLNGATLTQNVDYTVTYSDNLKPGVATATITGTGNYCGTSSVNFTVLTPSIANFKISNLSHTTQKIYWSKIKCTNYRVYGYNYTSKKWELLATTTNTYYYSMNLTQGKYYKYKVVGNCSGVYTQKKIVGDYTMLKTLPNVRLSVVGSGVKVYWSKNTSASGYYIYRIDPYDWSGNGTKYIKTVLGASTTSYIDKCDWDYGYEYKVIAFKFTSTSKRIISKATYSDSYSNNINAICNGVTLKSRRSFTLIKTQGKTTTSSTVYLSDNDIAILKKFARDNFTSSMTRAEKLDVVSKWINRNVKYASTSADWNAISDKSYVEAAFVTKKGQCNVYNGAMVAMMTYLGYNVKLNLGYLGTPKNHWQHYWGEMTVAGKRTIIEVGNFGNDGDWRFFFRPYEGTSFMLNGKNV